MSYFTMMYLFEELHILVVNAVIGTYLAKMNISDSAS